MLEVVEVLLLAIREPDGILQPRVLAALDRATRALEGIDGVSEVTVTLGPPSGVPSSCQTNASPWSVIEAMRPAATATFSPTRAVPALPGATITPSTPSDEPEARAITSPSTTSPDSPTSNGRACCRSRASSKSS